MGSVPIFPILPGTTSHSGGHANDYAGKVKLFSCDNCQQVLFFENSRCMNCGMNVGYCVELAKIVTVQRQTGSSQGSVYEVFFPNQGLRHYRQCKNASDHDACNWLVPAESQQPFCNSCRLTEVAPDLADPNNRIAWAGIEAAKRRLLYTLYSLKLPLSSRQEWPNEGVAFHFLRSTPDKPVMTGHDEGIITINIAEADSAFRENMREKMGEAYRTVLGHLRHEIGHYYWDRLIRNSGPLGAFRQLFGDDTLDYDQAVQRHYEQGAPANWSESYISAYASMHPWEDWAETWAHYLHMVDTLETAKSHGLTLRMPAAERYGEQISTDAVTFRDFDSLTSSWNAVTLALNSLNRSMGLKDAYPFVLSAKVLEKLRFVHDLIQTRRAEQKSGDLRATG
jgi:hypothetical protein